MKPIHLFVLTITALTGTITSPAQAAPTIADIHPDTVWTDSIRSQFGPRHAPAPDPRVRTGLAD